MFNKFIRGWVLLDIVLLNLVLAFLLYHNVLAPTYEEEPSFAALAPVQSEEPIATTNSLPTLTPSVAPSSTPAEISTPSSPTSSAAPGVLSAPVRTVSYISMSGTGQSTSTDWVDVEGSSFYFDRSDYPKMLEAYIEVNIRLMNGNGTAFARLYDSTNGREVDRSVLTTSSQDLVTLTGGPISLWEGNNLYKIQIRTLTADTVVYESGRIKLITEN